VIPDPLTWNGSKNPKTNNELQLVPSADCSTEATIFAVEELEKCSDFILSNFAPFVKDFLVAITSVWTPRKKLIAQYPEAIFS